MEVSFIRGNVIQFSTQFFDASGDIQTPVSATITLRTAPLGSTPQTIVLDLVLASETWSVLWDTSGIPPGTVFWSVLAVGPHAADDGTFYLEANQANL